MRKQDSTFNAFCEFINSKPIGHIYRTQDMLSVVAATETMTGWKRSTRSTASGRYQTMLKYAGFIGHERRGHWVIKRYIPEWFTSAHLFTLIGHETTIRTKKNRFGELKIIEARRCWMTQAQIRAKLSTESYTNTPNVILTTHINGKIVDNPRQELDRIADQEYQQMKNSTIPVSTTVTVKSIQPEESTFFQNPEAGKYEKQLQENLMVNYGYINSALAILDQAEFLDPVQHARTVNIIAQLKDLQRVLDERISLKRTTPNSNL